MTLAGIGDVSLQDVGQALTTAGTLVNPGAVYTSANGTVTYTPAGVASANNSSLLEIAIGGLVIWALMKK